LDADEIKPSKGYLARDVAMVEATDLLIACPKGPEQERGSGTWFTVRAARARGKMILIIWPDGRVTDENMERNGLRR
jgi:hypothetical protein